MEPMASTLLIEKAKRMPMTLSSSLLYLLSFFSWFRGFYVYRGIVVQAKFKRNQALSADYAADWLAIFSYFCLGTLLLILAI